MKRGPNDLDEIIDRLKKENKRLKSKIKTLVNTKFVDKFLNCKESMKCKEKKNIQCKKSGCPQQH